MSDILPVPCRICGKPVAVEIPAEDEPYHDSIFNLARNAAVHDRCHDQQQSALVAAKVLSAESARQTSWQTLCPPEFRKPIDWMNKRAKRVNHDAVMSWQFGSKGLFIQGRSGLCKTRFVWVLLKREYSLGRSIQAHTHIGFRQTLSALASNDPNKLKTFAIELSKADILFLDDFGKGKATPAADEATFDLLDARLRYQLPTIFTTDLTLETIESNFGDNYYQGAMRRITESSTILEFT